MTEPKITKAELRQLRRTTMREFLDSLQRFGHMTNAEIDKELERKDATMFERIFAGTVSAAAKGDKDCRQIVLERLWGKVKDVVEVQQEIHDEQLERVPRDAIVRLLREAK